MAGTGLVRSVLGKGRGSSRGLWATERELLVWLDGMGRGDERDWLRYLCIVASYFRVGGTVLL